MSQFLDVLRVLRSQCEPRWRSACEVWYKVFGETSCKWHPVMHGLLLNRVCSLPFELFVFRICQGRRGLEANTSLWHKEMVSTQTTTGPVRSVMCRVNFVCCATNHSQGSVNSHILSVRLFVSTWPKKNWQKLIVDNDSGKAGFPRDDAPRAVPSDARHDGWYEPEGRSQGCAWRISLFAQERMTRITFETFNVPVEAVVRLRRHRRQHGWTCPQLPAIDIILPALRRGHVQDLAQEMLPNLLKDVDEQTIFDLDEEEEQEVEEEEQPSEQNWPPEVGMETCGEAGRPLDAEQTWCHWFLAAWYGWTAVGGKAS